MLCSQSLAKSSSGFWPVVCAARSDSPSGPVWGWFGWVGFPSITALLGMNANRGFYPLRYTTTATACLLPFAANPLLVIRYTDLLARPGVPYLGDEPLDDPLGGRRARRHPDSGDGDEPVREKLPRRLDVNRVRVDLPADLREPPRVRAVVAAEDDHQVGPAGDRGRLPLAQDRGVADRVEDAHLGEAFEGRGDELHQVVERLGRLGDYPRLPDPRRFFQVRERGDRRDARLDVADDALDFGMVGVPHHDDGIPFAGKRPRVLLRLVHEGTGRVDDRHALAGERLMVR